MQAKLDLSSYEAGVDAYLGGADSTGWPLLDCLERNLAVGLPERGGTDEAHARALLSRIRSKLSMREELAMTTAELGKVTAELRAGLQELAQDHADPELWSRVVLKSFEKKMYEERMKAARASRRRPRSDAFWAIRRMKSSWVGR